VFESGVDGYPEGVVHRHVGRVPTCNARVEPDGDRAVRVSVVGDLVAVTADAVFHALTDALTADGPGRMDVDLAEVRLLDAVGIGVLLAARNRAASHGIAFRASGAVGPARGALESAGVLGLLGG
jgi:anti-anti-sigma regulatory factor